MSRSNQTSTAANPAKYVLEWAGDRDAGYVKRYDKEKKENVQINSLTFAYLDEMVAILGWSQKHKSSIYSNECRRATDNFVVLTFEDGKSKKLLEGKYKDIKADANDLGGRYHKVIYGVALESDDPELPNGTVFRMKIKGAGVKAWGDFNGKNRGAIKISAADGQNGAVKYKYPVFESVGISVEDDDKAIKADIELQEFFRAREAAYLDKDDVIEAPKAEDQDSEDGEDVPF